MDYYSSLECPTSNFPKYPFSVQILYTQSLVIHTQIPGEVSKFTSFEICWAEGLRKSARGRFSYPYLLVPLAFRAPPVLPTSFGKRPSSCSCVTLGLCERGVTMPFHARRLPFAMVDLYDLYLATFCLTLAPGTYTTSLCCLYGTSFVLWPSLENINIKTSPGQFFKLTLCIDRFIVFEIFFVYLVVLTGSQARQYSLAAVHVFKAVLCLPPGQDWFALTVFSHFYTADRSPILLYSSLPSVCPRQSNTEDLTTPTITQDEPCLLFIF